MSDENIKEDLVRLTVSIEKLATEFELTRKWMVERVEKLEAKVDKIEDVVPAVKAMEKRNDMFSKVIYGSIATLVITGIITLVKVL